MKMMRALRMQRKAPAWAFIPTQILYDDGPYLLIGPSREQVTVPGVFAYELVDRATQREVFLHSKSAELMTRAIEVWHAEAPDQSEVEEFFAGMMQLGAVPLIAH